MTLYKVVFG